MMEAATVAAVRWLAVEKRFGEAWALDGPALTVPVGMFYLRVGENGAGKTTTLRLLLDLVRADRGRVEVFGLEPRREAARVRAQIGWVPERSHVGDGHVLHEAERLAEHVGVLRDGRLCAELLAARYRPRR